MVRRITGFAISLLSVALLVSVVAACTPTTTPTPTPTAAPASKEAAKPTNAATASSPAPSSPTAKPAAKALEKIKIHVPSISAGRMEFLFGTQKGIFAEEGLDAEIIQLQSNLGLPALLKGDVDYVTVTSSTFQAFLKGEPVITVMELKMNNTWQIFLKPGLTTAKDIDGQPLALNSREGTNMFATEKMLKSLGLDPARNSFVVIPTYPDMVAGLKSGAISAATISSPENYRALDDGLKRLIDSRDVVEITTSSLATTQKKIQENPDQVKRAMRAVLKSIAYMKSHKDESVQFLMKQFNLDQTMAQRILDEELGFRSPNGTVTDKGITSHLEILQQSDAALSNVTLDNLKKSINTTLIQQVQKELGLPQ